MATTTIGGLFGVQNNNSNNEAQQRLAREEVQGQLDIKRTEVEGQIRVQELVAEAERDRLEIEQKFQIVVQATKGLPPDVASENLRFFVEAGILDDPSGQIRALAEEGRAPDLPANVGQQRTSNPLLERVAQMEQAAQTARAPSSATGYTIENGILQRAGGAPVQYVEAAAHGDEITPRYVIFHFTNGVGPGLVGWLTSDSARASTHVLVRRDGSVVQLLPFDHKAWHVGASRWGSLVGLNKDSIAIEMENLGQLQPEGDAWRTWNGKPVPSEEVYRAADGTGWHAFTDAQLATAKAVLETIKQADPNIIDILGHADVSPGRKVDPGPAFPMEDFREAVFDRRAPLPPPG